MRPEKENLIERIEAQAHTGVSVKRATNALELKHKTDTTANPATCTENNILVNGLRNQGARYWKYKERYPHIL